MPDETNHSASPSPPDVDLDLSDKASRRMRYIAFGLGAATIVLSGLTAMGFFQKEVMQAFGGSAVICQGLSMYFNRNSSPAEGGE